MTPKQTTHLAATSFVLSVKAFRTEVNLSSYFFFLVVGSEILDTGGTLSLLNLSLCSFVLRRRRMFMVQSFLEGSSYCIVLSYILFYKGCLEIFSFFTGSNLK